MKKYVCDVCGWVYDEAEGYPEAGIAPGTKFEDLPEDFECPLCAVGKDQFSEEYIRKEIAQSGKGTLLLKLTPEHICGKLVNEA